MSFVFGPVPSRRLGLSLGVDIIPLKTCTLSCIYCQIGKTSRTTMERRPYVTFEQLKPEIEEHLRKGQNPDWITLSGSGEPTLNSDIGSIIAGIKSIVNIPVCVITNGTLLFLPEVRSALLEADAVMPSLDSAREETFKKICTPHPDIHPAKVIDGLVMFRKEYTGKLWLEILFVKDMNDSDDEIQALFNAVQLINPDAVHLNTVVRPPAEPEAHSVTAECLEEIRSVFGPKAQVIASFSKPVGQAVAIDADDILDYLKRRPGSVEDIAISLGAGEAKVKTLLRKLKQEGLVKEKRFYGKRFWEYVID